MAIVEEAEEVLATGNLGRKWPDLPMLEHDSALGSLEEGRGEAGGCMSSSC